ncbi:MAG TPA: zinc-ribbon domain-containing protein [Ktedonobacterales bacterium]
MIIWGTRRRNNVLGQLQYVCPGCHQPTFHGLVRSKYWFTLFFIPVFPFSTSTTARCMKCGFQEKVNNKQADEMIHQGQLVAAPPR